MQRRVLFHLHRDPLCEQSTPSVPRGSLCLQKHCSGCDPLNVKMLLSLIRGKIDQKAKHSIDPYHFRIKQTCLDVLMDLLSCRLQNNCSSAIPETT